MRYEKSWYKFIPQAPGKLGAFKQAEFGARLCYRTEDKMDNENSHERIFGILDKGGHKSPYAHATCYTTWPIDHYLNFLDQLSLIDMGEGYTAREHFLCPGWTRSVYDDEAGVVYVTTNYRVIKELDLEEYWDKYYSEPTKHVRRYSILVRTDIGVTREWNRHGVACSINEESTRYCDYSKDKHGGEVAYIEHENDPDRKYYNELAEDGYFKALEEGKPPQLARRRLNLNTATTALYTAFPDMWRHLLDLRTASGAHPDIREIAEPLYQEFKDKGIL